MKSGKYRVAYDFFGLESRYETFDDAPTALGRIQDGFRVGAFDFTNNDGSYTVYPASRVSIITSRFVREDEE